MSWIFIAVVLFAAITVLAALNSKHHGAGVLGFPYQPAKALFSPAERSFLGVLEQAIGSDYRVFGKVRLADLALVKTGLSQSARRGALNQLAGKHVDFVVCRTSDLAVVCAVELNDKSHADRRRQERDAFLAKVCETIHLPLLTVPAKASYSVVELRMGFLAVLAQRPSTM